MGGTPGVVVFELALALPGRLEALIALLIDLTGVVDRLCAGPPKDIRGMNSIEIYNIIVHSLSVPGE